MNASVCCWGVIYEPKNMFYR
ncbi:cyclic lactone autoinducer peptide [Salmonella enterica subsp. enterica]|nr:cyclic lactone autoinducer peptide [Salmonella enterica subsp. enterica]